jgi:hypothetical protein|tara:strand:+ start:302 stop:469 length:168 start_codon:yes stop_codon:yes gene_type:complete
MTSIDDSKKIREALEQVRQGRCIVCWINLYGKKEQMPCASTLPCEVKNCPYPKFN